MKSRTLTVGINQRLPFALVESAFLGIAETGKLNKEQILEEARTYFSGENRQNKTLQLIRRIANEMFRLETHGFSFFQEFISSSAMKRKTLFIIACSLTYPIFYDTLCILGSAFGIQQEISTGSIMKKLSIKYGSNKAVENGLSAIIPMLMECGLITRKTLSIYSSGTPFIVEDPFHMELLLYTDIICSNLTSLVKEDIAFRPYLRFFTFDIKKVSFNKLISVEESRSGGGYVIPFISSP